MIPGRLEPRYPQGDYHENHRDLEQVVVREGEGGAVHAVVAAETPSLAAAEQLHDVPAEVGLERLADLVDLQRVDHGLEVTHPGIQGVGGIRHVPFGQDLKAEACIEADIAGRGGFQKGGDAGRVGARQPGADGGTNLCASVDEPQQQGHATQNQGQQQIECAQGIQHPAVFQGAQLLCPSLAGQVCVALGVRFEQFGGQHQKLEQDTLYTAQFGLRYDFNPQYSLTGTYYYTVGGETTYNGVEQGNITQLQRYQVSGIGNYAFGRITLQYSHDLKTENGYLEDKRLTVRYTLRF